LVEAYRRFTPRDVDRVLGGVSPLVRKVMHDPPIIVVAPWLSPRSRELLTERGLNYLDLTGNVRLKVVRPAVRLRLDGAQHDPSPPTKSPVRLQGSSINALVRILVDVEPPYRLVELARASGLSNGYVSRALEALHEERLIERAPASKMVTNVDWQGLLRARAEHYNLLDSNQSGSFIARSGPAALYRRLGEHDDSAAVTGSFAAVELVRLVVPTQLALYVSDADDFARRYELMPAQQGANVVLLRAADKSQLDRPRQVADKLHVGVSQLAIDLLAGNGRLPEEGEAVLDWMAGHPAGWQLPRLPSMQ
jgi:hypothetical protein